MKEMYEKKKKLKIRIAVITSIILVIGLFVSTIFAFVNMNNDKIMKETSKIFSYHIENPSNDMDSIYNNNFRGFFGGINNYSSSNNTNLRKSFDIYLAISKREFATQ